MHVPTPTYEPPTAHDVQQLARLRAEYWQEARAAGGAPQEPFEPEYRLQQRRVAELLGKQGQFLRVARLGERLIGHVQGEVATTAFLGLLIVAPEFREQGIGTKLFNDFRAAVPDGMPIELIVHGPDRKRLETFYERLGFERTDEETMQLTREAV